MSNEDLTQKLITEEAKRMINIAEYSFIGITEDDEEVDDLAADAEAPAEPAPEGGDEMAADAPEVDGEMGDLEAELGLDDEPAAEEPMDTPMDAPAEDDVDISIDDEPAEDEVELDVTELVNSTEEAKASSDAANAKLEDLIRGFGALEQQLGAMQQTSAKIDELGNKVTELEHDIERRNPTPEEQIEMRSLDSYPYNIKLSDYWSEKEDKLAIPSSKQNGGTKEYTLTKQDVDNYSPTDIKHSFSNFEEDEVDF